MDVLFIHVQLVGREKWYILLSSSIKAFLTKWKFLKKIRNISVYFRNHGKFPGIYGEKIRYKTETVLASPVQFPYLDGYIFYSVSTVRMASFIVGDDASGRSYLFDSKYSNIQSRKVSD